jgi:hypothetical protein
MKEFTLTADFGLELPEGADPDKLTDTILDAIIAAVEAVGGFVGGGIVIKPAEVSDEETPKE